MKAPASLLAWWLAHGTDADAALAASPAGSVSLLQLAALASAGVGGAGHGVAMAVRKHYGAGQARYWLEWRWWLGVLLDAVAGLLIWPAMPIVSVQLLMPLVVVAQLAASYLLGLFFFGEKVTKQSLLGVTFAVAGVVGLSVVTPTGAASFHVGDFWARWLRAQFLAATAGCAAVLAGAFFLAHRCTFWALSAGFLEGVQFVCSRALADAVLETVLPNLAVLSALAIKGLCIVLIVHFQQMGLETDMSRFAGIYLVASTLFICTYGGVYFGDHVPLSLAFAGSATATLVGIWCLNEAEAHHEADGADKPLLPRSEQPDAEAKCA